MMQSNEHPYFISGIDQPKPTMQIKRDFEYYHNLHNLVTHALLHLLGKVSATSRHVPVSTRNEILIKYLKPKVNTKSLSNIKKDIKLMLSLARKKGGNLEMRLYDLNSQANRTKLAGAEKLYSLLVHLSEQCSISFASNDSYESSDLFIMNKKGAHNAIINRKHCKN